jgi:ATP-dependent DNA helicase DinG
VRQPDFIDDSLTLPLAKLQALVVTAIRAIEDDDSKASCRISAGKIRDARSGLATFLKQDAEDHVYWVSRRGKTQKVHSLNAAPVDVAAYLRALLFRENHVCVMTSATLSVGNEALTYFRERVGAMEVEALQIGSPFDYPRQMQLYVTRKMPDPRDDGYESALAEWIEHFVQKSKGRAVRALYQLQGDVGAGLGDARAAG